MVCVRQMAQLPTGCSTATKLAVVQREANDAVLVKGSDVASQFGVARGDEAELKD